MTKPTTVKVYVLITNEIVLTLLSNHPGARSDVTLFTFTSHAFPKSVQYWMNVTT